MKQILFSILASFILYNPSIAETKVLHVVVALCDNKYQAIAKVPSNLGNGQNPKTNLYWGAKYGVKTFMLKMGWEVVLTTQKPSKYILERIVFKHPEEDFYIVADAYDGKHIKEAVKDFFIYASGSEKTVVKIGENSIKAGGEAEYLTYIGHNAFMDMTIPLSIKHNSDNEQKQAAVFSCQSNKYFYDKIKKTGVKKVILTTGNMAPEAYNLNAAAKGWAADKELEEITEDVANAYSEYQKINKSNAKRLFISY